jgi:homoserine dehydrogenase
MAPSALRIGLIGFGTVGQAFARHLAAGADRYTSRIGVPIRVARVAVRDPARIRRHLTDIPVNDDALALARDPSIDVVVEATGAAEASDWLCAALARGAAAISANKLSIADSQPLLTALADRHPLFRCEGAVAAGVPVVRALRDALDGEEIQALRGVLNGTSTFVLSQVETGVTWDDAVREAQRAGYAEPGADADLSGLDAAAKLAILATVAWRRPIGIDRVNLRGLAPRHAARAREARQDGRRLRLVAEGWWAGTPRLVVEPRVLDDEHPLAHVSGVTTTVEVTCALAGLLRWTGPGAGGDRTASALLGDVISAARALLTLDAGRIAA